MKFRAFFTLGGLGVAISACLLALPLATSAQSNPALETIAQGKGFFEARCVRCHAVGASAPAARALALWSQSELIEIMTTGRMTAQAAGLTFEQKSAIGAFLTHQENGQPIELRPAEMVAKGRGLFDKRCTTCHMENGGSGPPPSILRTFTSDNIVRALTTGKMARQGRELTDQDKRSIGSFLTFVQAPAATPPAVSVPAPAATVAAANGEALFKDRCAECHEPAVERAPSRTVMATRSQPELVGVMTTGIMAPMAEGLTRPQIEAIAAFIAPPPAQAAGPRGGRGAAVTTTDVKCTVNPPIKASGSDWTMVGYDVQGSRFQRNPGIKAADVPKLKVKWAFSLAGHGNAQPVVVGDWLWIASRGRLYALDPKSGCVRWRVDGVSARNTPPVLQSTISPSGWVMIVAQGSKVVKAFDAANGKEIWASEALESHRSSGITGSPIVAGNQVFVPITSGEEATSGGATYSCCTFRGSLVALDLATGKTQWRTFMINEPMKPIRTNAVGVQLQGPAGAAIWSAPTADLKRGLVYVATGDSYTDADTIGADAIVAVEMKTGKIRWNTQVTEDDNFIMNCAGERVNHNCPTPLGPDFDFGASPILFTLANGKQVVLSGQKSSIAYGMDPDTGKQLWRHQTGQGSELGGIEWGIAADNRYLFAPNADIVNMFDAARRERGEKPASPPRAPARPGLTAINPANGKAAWHAAPPKAPCQFRGDRSRDRVPGACFNAMSSAPAVMPGVVFQGTTDGWFRAYNAANGKVVWAFSTTAQTYRTANGVAEQPGGSIDGNGPVIAGGMVYTMSGYDGATGFGGNGTNVLLAFSVDGK